MNELRYFTAEGRAKWSEWLTALRENPSLPFPEGLLINPDITRRVPGGLTIEAKVFASRFELAAALAPAVAAVQAARFPADSWPGLWDWLAAFHFDSICPAGSGGARNVREHARYTVSAEYNRRYRHRIMGPVDLQSRFGASARLQLHGAPDTISDWEEQTASRYQISSNRGIAEALYRLYWDEAKNAPKRSAAPNRRVPGTFRRFIDLVQQLDRTYDLISIAAPAILDLLPKEFAGFRGK